MWGAREPASSSGLERKGWKVFTYRATAVTFGKDIFSSAEVHSELRLDEATLDVTQWLHFACSSLEIQ